MSGWLGDDSVPAEPVSNPPQPGTPEEKKMKFLLKFFFSQFSRTVDDDVGNVEAVVAERIVRVEIDEAERAGRGDGRRIGRAAELAQQRIGESASVADLEKVVAAVVVVFHLQSCKGELNPLAQRGGNGPDAVAIRRIAAWISGRIDGSVTGVSYFSSANWKYFKNIKLALLVNLFPCLPGSVEFQVISKPWPATEWSDRNQRYSW